MSDIKSVSQVKNVPIMLDRERNLRFDLNAFANLEEAFGSIDTALKNMEQGSVKAVRAILWAALVHEDPTLTQQYIGSLLSVSELEAVAAKLTEAITGVMPTQEEVSKNTESTGVNP